MKTSDIIKNRIGDKRVAILGFGISNAPLAEILLECGNEITVYDKADLTLLDSRAKALSEHGVRFVTGDGYLDYIDADIIFRSPGIRPDSKAIVEAVKRGAELTSEMELFMELTPATVIGITGSDGKTTTTTITYKMLSMAFSGTSRKVYVGGNIGNPLLSELDRMCEKDVCVLELSSFQLFTMKKSPQRAVITNISPNHLDWHRDMNEYISAKTNIFTNGARILTTNANDAICLSIAQKSKSKINLFSAKLSLDDILKKCPDANSIFYLKNGSIFRYCEGASEYLLDASNIRVPGIHNIENYMAAISLTCGDVNKDTIKELAESFCGVEHRLEFVRELEGVKYYNSSIDSSPSRTAAALSALVEKPIVICGGYDKKIPFAPLAATLDERAKAVILTGATAEKICEELRAINTGITIHIEKDFERAVLLARSVATNGDTVLLSPACASFDAFRNFAERGNTFKKIVNEFK